jgi:hypothetical protein
VKAEQSAPDYPITKLAAPATPPSSINVTSAPKIVTILIISPELNL